jgi:hypothetical protein
VLEFEEVDEDHILLHPDEYTGERSLGDMLDAAEPEINTGVTDKRIRQGKLTGLWPLKAQPSRA